MTGSGNPAFFYAQNYLRFCNPVRQLLTGPLNNHSCLDEDSVGLFPGSELWEPSCLLLSPRSAGPDPLPLVLGSGSLVLGSGSFALDSGSPALALDLLALASGSTVLGSRSLVLGSGSMVLDSRSLVLGSGSLVLDSRSLVLGSGSMVLDSRSLVLGSRALVTGCRSLLFFLVCCVLIVKFRGDWSTLNASVITQMAPKINIAIFSTPTRPMSPTTSK